MYLLPTHTEPPTCAKSATRLICSYCAHDCAIPVTASLLYKNSEVLYFRPQLLDCKNHLVAEVHTISNLSFSIVSSSKKYIQPYLCYISFVFLSAMVWDCGVRRDVRKWRYIGLHEHLATVRDLNNSLSYSRTNSKNDLYPYNRVIKRMAVAHSYFKFQST
jgi:hypothetical protein